MVSSQEADRELKLNGKYFNVFLLSTFLTKMLKTKRL